MTPLTHFAEPYAPQGNIDARAAARAIGRPRLDPWDIFLRETLQNSWDARLDEAGPICYSIDGYWPTEDQLRVLREVVFRTVRPGSPLEAYLNADHDAQPVLVVTDAGTKGLGGPTRADEVSSEPTDFVDFVRNVGRAADKALGGGTYGFGKGILWQMSGCSTVLIYTKSTFRGQPVSRFIAMGHTDSFSSGGKRFTGRHWWGQEHPETKIEPIEGAAADSLAAAIGMNRLVDEASGTSIMVLEPQGSEHAHSMDDIVGRVAGAALWWAWPHLVDKTISFDLSSEGESLQVPDPDSHPVLRHFADAYRRTSGMEQSSDEWPWKQQVLHMHRPSRRLGSLVWRRVSREELDADSHSHVEISSHVALMRRPRFVVQYKPVREDPHGQGTVGVFVAHGDLNDDFAKSEPVAHDDWSPSEMGLAKGARNPVKRALDLIRDAFNTAALQVPPEVADGQHQTGLVKLASKMGDLVLGSGDAAYAPQTRTGGGSTAPKSLSARVVGRPVLNYVDGRAVALFDIEAKVPAGSALPVRMSVTPHVLTESGVERGEELEQPAIQGWSLDDARARQVRSGVLLENFGSHTAQVRVTVPPDSAVGLSVYIREEGRADT